jgi:maleate isomerase
MSQPLRICVVMPEDGNQQDLIDFTPAGITLDFQLTPLPPEDATVSLLMRLAADPDIESAALCGARQRPACITYACTAASFVRGKGGDAEINRRITAVTGIPASTTSTALLRALRAMNIRRLAVATPYLDELNDRLECFLEAHGIRVVSMQGLNAKVIQQVLPHEIVQLARDCDSPDAEAVFISCTTMKTAPYIAELEASLQKPVLTANQITLWDAVQLAGAQPVTPDRGSLFGRKTGTMQPSYATEL